jgi:hypothetical protein
MADIASEAGLRAVDPFVPSISKLCVYLWDEAWQAAPQVLEGDDEALHDMRVALRRLRSTLENSAILGGDFVREDIADELTFERRALRKIGDALGAVRDYDVLLQYLEEYRATQTGGASEASGEPSEEEEQRMGWRNSPSTCTSAATRGSSR